MDLLIIRCTIRPVKRTLKCGDPSLGTPCMPESELMPAAPRVYHVARVTTLTSTMERHAGAMLITYIDSRLALLDFYSTVWCLATDGSGGNSLEYPPVRVVIRPVRLEASEIWMDVQATFLGCHTHYIVRGNDPQPVFRAISMATRGGKIPKTTDMGRVWQKQNTIHQRRPISKSEHRPHATTSWRLGSDAQV
jgi:hypothetical protein